MIQTLRVRNLAVIEELELELGPGLNALTGETGAGKSVLLSAIALLSGRRVSSEEIRSGEDEARVEALIASPQALARARERGLAGDADEELLVVRTLAKGGRGRAFVNGRLATVKLLAEVVGDEVEVTSQAEHQRLLQPEHQAELLDRHADLEALAQELRAAHARWRESADELEDRRTRREERARREDQLRFELEQIESADPRPDELEALEQEHQRLAHVERLGASVETALALLQSDGGLNDAAARARAALQDARALDAALAEPDDGLERAQLELVEVERLLEGYRGGLEADPRRLEQVDARLGELARLQSRYGATLDDVLAYRDRARAELEELDGGEQRTAELEAELAARAEALERLARQLGAGRREAARTLTLAVQAELGELELGKARFEVAFEPLSAKSAGGVEAPSGPSGLERAQFRLAANPGEEARRLRDAASGGELARLLLALRNVLRDAEGGRVLLFDEVDAGIGGRTARKVGERLRALGRTHQTLCITHLAPIAGLAERHYKVEKRARGGRTRTRVVPLAGEARIDEIARMTGGGRLTEAARTHARELLRR